MASSKAEIRRAKRCIRSMPMPAGLEKAFRQNGLAHLLPDVYSRTVRLLDEHRNDSKAKQIHLRQLLPCIAMYEVLTVHMGDRQQALAWMEKHCFVKIEKMAALIPLVMKIPGLYRLVPRMMEGMLDRMFGHEAGFDYVRREAENGFAVDMTRCPYVETCEQYHCPELAAFCCVSDDICYGNMHPRLQWERTQTLGTGGTCCDFRMTIKDK